MTSETPDYISLPRCFGSRAEHPVRGSIEEQSFLPPSSGEAERKRGRD